MNKILFSSIVLLLLIPASDAFGTYQTELGDDVFILVQSIIRNSDGSLIVYLESTKFSDLNMSALENFLDFETSRGNDPTITIDENDFQVIRRVQSQSFNSEGLVPSTVLLDNVDEKPLVLARFAHDGYTVVPGDTIESIWTFVRSVS